MSKRYKLVLYGIAIVLVFFVSMQLFARPGDNCIAGCYSAVGEYCNQICNSQQSQCLWIMRLSAYCIYGWVCYNVWKVECENGKAYYYHCEVFDWQCR